jgi:hypothetical protein
MAKKNATTVSVMPVRNDPDARLLQQIFRMTTEEYLFLKFLASAARPSDCTARQRLLFRKLQESCRVEVIEYPCLDGPRWVLSTSGEAIFDGAARLLPGITSGPAKILQFPSLR